MYGEMGQKSNTMIFSSNPADVNALIAQASTVFQAVAARNTTIAAPAAPLIEESADAGGENDAK